MSSESQPLIPPDQNEETRPDYTRLNLPPDSGSINDAEANAEDTHSTTNKSLRTSFFQRARKILLVIGVLYVSAVILLCIPFFQSHALYLNAIKIPFFADFTIPEKFGLAPNKTLNFQLHTPDNVTLGAWFVLSDKYYRSLPSPPSTQASILDEHIPQATNDYPTILFLHGNAATRAFHVRVRYYQAFSSRFGANVLAIDYRGFADSEGKPSEQGLIRDARTALEWLLNDIGVRPQNITVVGHSLGTGVASGLMKQLWEEEEWAGRRPRGVALLSPFSSIREVLNTYHILGAVPLMRPLSLIPGASQLITWALTHKFDSLSASASINGTVLIAHAEDDWDIPWIHGQTLFDAFVGRYLPAASSVPLKNLVGLSHDDWALFSEQEEERKKKRDELVTQEVVRGFRVVEYFSDEYCRVMFVKSEKGGHDYLAIQEGVQDYIWKWVVA